MVREMDKIIDFSAHVSPPEVEKLLNFSANHAPNALEDRLKVMDNYGVDVQVVHLSASHLYGLNAERTSRACEAINDYIYDELINKKPERFVGCGILNLQDIDFSLRELDRVLDRGFKCVTLPTHHGSVNLDHPSVLPLLEELSRRKLALFLHPMTWEGYAPVEDRDLMSALGWPFDTSVALWKLISGGLLDRLSGLRIVAHHMGSTLPYYKDRIEIRLMRSRGNKYKPLSSYVGQLHADTALDGGSLADLLVGYSLFGSKGLLFGSDWPFIDETKSIGRNLNTIRAMPIPEEERNRILHNNAYELLRLGP